MKIPFFKINFDHREEQAVLNVMRSGWVVMGSKTREFEEKFAEYVGAKYAVFFDSGTSALFLAFKAQESRIKEYNEKWWPGTEVEIELPSLTFVSDAEVIVNAGFKPRFKDISLKTFCLEQGEKLVGGTGKHILTVHLTGNRSKYRSHIYDSAHRIEKDDLKDNSLNEFDDVMWCYSFYATKNMTTVQGGMIALNDKDKYEWLKKARDHGMSKGTVERYTEKTPYYSVDFVGYRVKGDDVRAAIGLEQLKKLPEMTARRNEIVARYNKNLELNRTGNHLYPILVKDRDKFFDEMEKAEIQCSVHFLPLHKMPAFQKYCDYPLPNTEYLGERLVSIPLFPQMTNEEIDYISEKVLQTGLLIKE